MGVWVWTIINRICKNKSKIFNRWTIVADWLVNRWSDRKRNGMFETQAEFSSAARSTFWFWRKWSQAIFVVRVVALINSWTGTSWGALGVLVPPSVHPVLMPARKPRHWGSTISNSPDIVGSNRLLGAVSVIETDPSPTLPSPLQEPSEHLEPRYPVRGTHWMSSWGMWSIGSSLCSLPREHNRTHADHFSCASTFLQRFTRLTHVLLQCHFRGFKDGKPSFVTIHPFSWPFHMFQADDRNDMTNSGIMFLGWLAQIETCWNHQRGR